MKYVIMCGGKYAKWDKPKHLTEIDGEPLVARTIRLLKEIGINDIAISSNNEVFKKFKVPVLSHDNKYFLEEDGAKTDWVDGFYPMSEPVCYLFGDVIFSRKAIETIVKTQTDDIMFFASSPPFAPNYSKGFGEPFGFKVVNTKRFFECIERTKQYDREGRFGRQPVSWELWQVIKGTPLNEIDFHNYTEINDYTCDIDFPEDVEVFYKARRSMRFMIHSCNARQWYVDNYLVPSMIEQGINREDIYVYQDVNSEGNLKSFIKSCHLAYEMWGEVNVWHLQDDVILSRHFKEQVDELESNKLRVICGFTCQYDDGRGPGDKECKNHMWYSFPCIRINSRLSKEFASWCDTYLWRDNQFGFWIRYKKGDDYIFRIFMESYHPHEHVLNLVPNIIDHVDFLLGGTVVNPQREKQSVNVRSMYWDENDLVIALGDRIRKEKYNE